MEHGYKKGTYNDVDEDEDDEEDDDGNDDDDVDQIPRPLLPLLRLVSREGVKVAGVRPMPDTGRDLKLCFLRVF